MLFFFQRQFFRSLLILWLSGFTFRTISLEIPVTKPNIIQVIPHTGRGFTQGLFYQDSLLYEGTGLVGHSVINVINPKNGSIKKTITLEKYFGEGIAVLGNQLVQLTWKAGKAFRFTFPALKPAGEFSYQGEGWGLTSDSIHFIMSDGSGTLFFRDSGFNITRKIEVTANGQSVQRLNELEYARGFIYANVWMTDFILRIDPETGRVLTRIDCGELLKIENPASTDNVLNGIGYNSVTGTFYLTGKRWENIFEVVIPE